MFESGQEALPDVRLLSGGPPGFAGVVGSPFRMSGSPFRTADSGQLALPDVREWS